MSIAGKPKVTQSEAAEWYDNNAKIYEEYAKCVYSLLESLLKAEGLPYQSISYRVKERGSYLDKCKRKTYGSFEEITDVAGLRIIAYTIGDVERICALVEQELKIDRDNSVDKATQLNSDQMGYLSVHYIASFTTQRARLREYRAYKGMKCEIQVRTLLQHAWAEIEHDRSYKFSGTLPLKIKRRFYLLAGTLELVDREFQSLSNEIDKYGEQVAEDTKQGKLDILIDSISLLEYMRKKVSWADCEDYWGSGSSEIVTELHDMGIDTLAQLEEMISPILLSKEYLESPHSRNYIGFLRDAMILYDSEKYFSTAWNGHWQITSYKSVNFWKENGVNIDLHIRECGIHIFYNE